MKIFLLIFSLIVVGNAIAAPSAGRVDPIDETGKLWVKSVHELAAKNRQIFGDKDPNITALQNYLSELDKDWDSTLKKPLSEVERPARMFHKALRFHYANIVEIEFQDVDGIQNNVNVNSLAFLGNREPSDSEIRRWWDAEYAMIKSWYALYSKLGPAKVMQGERELKSVQNQVFLLQGLTEHPDLMARLDRNTFRKIGRSAVTALKLFPESKHFKSKEPSDWDPAETVERTNIRTYYAYKQAAEDFLRKLEIEGSFKREEIAPELANISGALGLPQNSVRATD